jgi:hypothetical protein
MGLDPAAQAGFACISEQEGYRQSTKRSMQDFPDEHWRARDLV